MFPTHRLAAALLAALLLIPALAGAQDARERPGWLGVRFAWSDASAERAEVAAVVPGSAAEEAGVRRGDVILRIDGRAATRAEVERLAGRLSPGDEVRLRLLRDGRERDLRVTAGERPQERIVIVDGERLRAVQADSLLRRLRIDMDSVHRHIDSVRVHVERLRDDPETRREMERLRAQALRMADSLRDDPEMRREMERAERVALRMSEKIVHLDDGTMIVDGDTVRMPDVSFFRMEPFQLRMEELRAAEAPLLLELGRRALAGAELAEMNDGLARYFRVDEGLLVLRVEDGTPAARAGLEAGDVIVRAGGEPVRDLRDLRRAVARADDADVPLEVVRQGRRRTLSLAWRGARAGVLSVERLVPSRIEAEDDQDDRR